MAAVMVERDAVLAAVRGLIGEALEGRGGALFVVGEAGLGKTTVLELRGGGRPGPVQGGDRQGGRR